MKKVIKLTESDLARIIKRVIKEEMKGPHRPGENMFASSPKITGNKFYDTEDRPVDDEQIDFFEKKTFGPDEYDDFMDYINNCNTKWCLTTKKYYDFYTQTGGPLVVGKGRRKNTEL